MNGTSLVTQAWVVESNDSFMHAELAKDDGVQLKSFA